MTETYRKFGRVVRRENDLVVHVEEAGEAVEEGGTFRCSPHDAQHELPAVDASAVPETANAILRNDLSDDEVRVVELVASPIPRDELIRSLKLPTQEANILLSAMELKGVIVEESGVVRVR